jgi:hypothetical protein
MNSDLPLAMYREGKCQMLMILGVSVAWRGTHTITQFTGGDGLSQYPTLGPVPDAEIR